MLNILDIGNKVGKAKEKAEQRYGGFQARLVAMTLDIGLSLFVLWPVLRFVSKAIYAGMDREAVRKAYIASEAPVRTLFESGYLGMWLTEQLVYLVIFMGVSLACWLKWGATPGKMLFAMKIVDAKTLERPKNWQFVVRALAYPFSLLVFGLGFVWIALNKRKRSWHDLLSGTVVISKLTPLSIKELFRKNKAPSEEGARSEEDQPNETPSRPTS